MGNEPKIRFVDVSAQVFGKYQFCSKNEKDGMWYADSDFSAGCGFGSVKRGSLPSPHQDTPELTAKAKKMHEESALPRKTILDRIYDFLFWRPS